MIDSCFSQVNPILYGDFRTHLFGYWTVDGFKQTGCFDMRCSGFVQISKELTLGSILEPTSNKTHQYENPFNVFLDKTGNWWLSACDISVGYWPSKLFTSMSNHAADLAFGGVTYNDPDKNPPPMGSGYYSDDEYTCYARDINIMDGDGVYKNLDSVDFDIDSFESNCYAQRVGDFKDGNGYTSYFSGQGCRF
ncbi:hypothetical protein IFM89_009387 [Coptis chinensis]|uniref:Neprosin PEP catalytic domain-containing protein n=1 Tax=Coptis chinensis TaxID=261450 RepID=A0A835LPW2_9MAGN|nr:hypothetical protein IFM89_009387 [Coptis chinensis]